MNTRFISNFASMMSTAAVFLFFAGCGNPQTFSPPPQAAQAPMPFQSENDRSNQFVVRVSNTNPQDIAIASAHSLSHPERYETPSLHSRDRGRTRANGSCVMLREADTIGGSCFQSFLQFQYFPISSFPTFYFNGSFGNSPVYFNWGQNNYFYRYQWSYPLNDYTYYYYVYYRPSRYLGWGSNGSSFNYHHHLSGFGNYSFWFQF